jgi:hypothetical protein
MREITCNIQMPITAVYFFEEFSKNRIVTSENFKLVFGNHFKFELEYFIYDRSQNTLNFSVMSNHSFFTTIMYDLLSLNFTLEKI